MKRKLAYTLAEVLITLVVIGIIATITIPSIVAVVTDRVNSSRQANIVYKITQATNMMKANGELTQFNTTDDFVNVLQKYLKITKRCDSNNLEKCWPTKYVTDSNGKQVDISTVKTANKLGLFKRGENNNVGLVLADGASIILSYDQSNKGLTPMEKLTSSATTLSSGSGKNSVREYTTNSTAGIAMIMDVNGAKGPNSETIGTKHNDIRSFNGASLAGCAGKKIGNMCYVDFGSSYNNIDCSRNGGWDGILIKSEYSDYCNPRVSNADSSSGGAQKTCNDLGMELVNYDELIRLCENHKNDLGIKSDTYWAFGHNACRSTVNFSNCQYNGCWDNNQPKFNLLCVASI